MDLPRPLAQWTYETVLELVTSVEFFRGGFDSKEVLQAESSHPNHMMRSVNAPAPWLTPRGESLSLELLIVRRRVRETLLNQKIGSSVSP